MKNTKVRALVLILVLAMLFNVALVGCSSKEAPKAPAPEQAAGPKLPKANMVAASQMPGSLYVTYISAWATLLMDQFEGLNVDQQPGGSSQNIVLVQNKEVDFGITTAATGYMGWYGIEWAKGVKYQNMKALMPAYPAVLGVFTLPKYNIKGIQDWEGKTIHVGPSGSASDVLGKQLAELFGIKNVKFLNSPWADAGDMLKDGLAQSVLYIAGHPVGFAQEVEVSQEMVVYGLTTEEIKKVSEKYPYYLDFKIPAGTYKALKNDLNTLVAFNYVFCDPDLPADFIYNVVKETYENVDVLKSAHPSFSHTSTDYLRYVPIPFHEGAIKYYTEKGAKLPELPPAPKQ